MMTTFSFLDTFNVCDEPIWRDVHIFFYNINEVFLYAIANLLQSKSSQVGKLSLVVVCFFLAAY